MEQGEHNSPAANDHAAEVPAPADPVQEMPLAVLPPLPDVQPHPKPEEVAMPEYTPPPIESAEQQFNSLLTQEMATRIRYQKLSILASFLVIIFGLGLAASLTDSRQTRTQLEDIYAEFTLQAIRTDTPTVTPTPLYTPTLDFMAGTCPARVGVEGAFTRLEPDLASQSVEGLHVAQAVGIFKTQMVDSQNWAQIYLQRNDLSLHWIPLSWLTITGNCPQLEAGATDTP